MTHGDRGVSVVTFVINDPALPALEASNLLDRLALAIAKSNIQGRD